MTAEATHLDQTVTVNHTRTVGVVTFLVATAIPIIGILTANAQGAEVEPGLGDWIFVGIVAATALATFGLLVPRILNNGGSRTGGLIVSVIAFLSSFVAFWTMIPLILGAAGGLIGYQTIQDSTKRTKKGLAISSMVFSGIAVIVSIVATIATS
jgi:hypothetical protein